MWAAALLKKNSSIPQGPLEMRQNRELSLFRGFFSGPCQSMPTAFSSQRSVKQHSTSPVVETPHLAVSKNIEVFVLSEVAYQGGM